MKRFFINLVFLLIFFLIAVAISLKNQFYINLNLILFQVDLKASSLIAVCLGIGFAFGLFSFLSSYFNLKFKYRKLVKVLKDKVKQS